MIWLFGVALAVIGLFPETPIGRQLRHVLIEAPCRWLAKLTAAKVVLWSLVTLGVSALIAAAFLIKEDGVILLQVIPDALAWFASVEVSTYLELIVAIWLVRSGLRLGVVRHFVGLAATKLGRAATRVVRATSRASRRQRHQRPLLGANDDEDRPQLAFA
jgi:hypothetical protein